MAVILYNAGKIKMFENLKAFTLMAGETEDFATELWQSMMLDDELLGEFNYFVENKTLKGEAKCGELTLLDIYFSQMNKYNLFHDMGKNNDCCDKYRMVLHAFKKMIDMRRDPNYLINFERQEQKGMDII